MHGSYTDPNAQVLHQVEYAWVHSMGEIVTVLANAGLHIEFLHEFPFAVEKHLPFLRPGKGSPASIPHPICVAEYR